MFTKASRFIASEITHICIVSCSLLAVALVMRAVVLPSAYSFVRTRSQRSVYRELVSDGDRSAKTKDLLLRKQAALDEKKSKLGFSTPAADLPSLLQLLIAKAKDADIRFVKMLPEADAKTEKNSYPVVLEMSTSFHSLGRFIASLETVPLALRIDRLAITAQKNDLDVRILVTCFFSDAKDRP